MRMQQHIVTEDRAICLEYKSFIHGSHLQGAAFSLLSSDASINLVQHAPKKMIFFFCSRARVVDKNKEGQNIHRILSSRHIIILLSRAEFPSE